MYQVSSQYNVLLIMERERESERERERERERELLLFLSVEETYTFRIAYNFTKYRHVNCIQQCAILVQ